MIDQLAVVAVVSYSNLYHEIAAVLVGVICAVLSFLVIKLRNGGSYQLAPVQFEPVALQLSETEIVDEVMKMIREQFESYLNTFPVEEKWFHDSRMRVLVRYRDKMKSDIRKTAALRNDVLKSKNRVWRRHFG